MAGYSWGQGMSWNAVEAYSLGRMPLSKWTKKAILQQIEEILKKNSDIKPAFSVFQKLRKDELKKLLICTEWHHTSSYFNETDFYAIDEDILYDLDENASQLRLPATPKKTKNTKISLAVIVVENWGRVDNQMVRLKNSRHVGVRKGQFVYTKDGKFKVKANRMKRYNSYPTFSKILEKFPTFEESRDFLEDFYKKHGKTLP